MSLFNFKFMMGEIYQGFIPEEQKSKNTNNKKRFVPSKERFVPSKERFVPSKERFVPSKERFVPSKERFVPYQHKIVADKGGKVDLLKTIEANPDLKEMSTDIIKKAEQYFLSMDLEEAIKQAMLEPTGDRISFEMPAYGTFFVDNNGDVTFASKLFKDERDWNLEKNWGKSQFKDVSLKNQGDVVPVPNDQNVERFINDDYTGQFGELKLNVKLPEEMLEKIKSKSVSKK